MSNKKRPSKRQLRIPVKFSDHVTRNLNQRRKEDMAELVTQEVRVTEKGLNHEIGGTDKKKDGGVDGSSDNGSDECDESSGFNDENVVKETKTVELEYEWRHDTCSHCKVFGHGVKIQSFFPTLPLKLSCGISEIQLAKALKNISVPTAIVSISASWSVDLTNGSSMIPASNFSFM
nr:hypothetical protein [Tanacetum cinerariifolium]